MKKPKDEIIRLKLFTSFLLAHWDNVINITMALNQSGYFTNIIKTSGNFIVNVYVRA
jgi:hypothetical protein